MQRRAPDNGLETESGPERLGKERFDPANRRCLSAPALRTFLAIADLWGLEEEERRLVLGYPSRSTLRAWGKAVRAGGHPTLAVDVLTRISAVLGIHQALGTRHEGERDGVAWLRRPHRATIFGGNPPMMLVIGGTLDGLMTLRRFLDAACGGLYMPPNGADLDFVPYGDAEIFLS